MTVMEIVEQFEWKLRSYSARLKVVIFIKWIEDNGI